MKINKSIVTHNAKYVVHIWLSLDFNIYRHLERLVYKSVIIELTFHGSKMSETNEMTELHKNLTSIKYTYRPGNKQTSKQMNEQTNKRTNQSHIPTIRYYFHFPSERANNFSVATRLGSLYSLAGTQSE